MEHRRDGQHGIVLAQGERVRHGFREGVQHQSAVRINHALGKSGCAGGETHRGPVIFVELRIAEILRRRRKRLFVTHGARGQFSRAAAVRNHDDLFKGHVLANLFVNRQEHVVNNQKPVPRVVCNRGDLVRVQPEIQGVQDASGAGHAEKHLQVSGMIPHHGGDPVAGV